MIVFGDMRHQERVADKLLRLEELLGAAMAMSVRTRGIGRHGLLVEALIEAGELAQGVADAHFAAHGRRDMPDAQAQAAMTLARWIAVQCVRSWDTRFEWVPSGLSASEALSACGATLEGEGLLDIRQPEGYAFYALYPECHLAAARSARRAIDGPWRVTGLRSIGTSLAAVAAAVLGDPAPRTLRPVGHPFDRRLASAGGPPPDPAEHHAIVDEGPGLSGSSIAAAIRHLRHAGVPPSRIHIFPGHANGPGVQASDEVRSLWRQARSHVAAFETVLLHPVDPVQRLRGWVEDIVGPLDAALEDVANGAWREAHARDGKNAPQAPAHPWQERRKFLARSGGTDWLVKFAGLGHRARERCECARVLGEAGFSPHVAGWCHGFIVQRWHGDLAPLADGEWMQPSLRPRLRDRLASYIAFRARRFPAEAGSGAPVLALCEMGRHNSRELLGADAGTDAMWSAYRAVAPRLQSAVRRVRTDNRMHAWEWLHAGDLLLKTDAVDHHAGHDLVGCQDPAWDVAGAAVEFGLDAAELGTLATTVAERGAVRIDGELLAFYTAAYLAFQMAHFRLAAREARNGQERARLEAQVERYMQTLERLVRHGQA